MKLHQSPSIQAETLTPSFKYTSHYLHMLKHLTAPDTSIRE